MVYAVALDPGGTTGVCLVPNRLQPWTLRTEEMGPKDHHRHLLVHLTLWKPEVIVCEDFDNRSNTAAILTSKEYIGIVKAYAEGRCKLVLQSASTGKGFWKDDKLRKHGVYAPGRHARDACRHYLYYRTFTLRDQSLLEGKAAGHIII